MRKSAWAGLAALFLMVFPAHASTDAFSGNWQSAKDTTEIRFIRIAPGGGNSLLLRVYGNCHPRVCLWGAVTARPEDPETPPEKVTQVTAVLNFAYAARTITLSLNRGHIAFSARYQFRHNAGTDLQESGTLVPSLWPAPWQKGSWEARDDDDIGWGGGTQGSTLPAPKEICQRFDPDTATLRPSGKDWQVRAGNIALFTTAKPEEKARDALTLIRHYGINQKCTAGGLTYWKKDGDFPDSETISRSCQRFSPTTAHLARIGHDWLVVDGDASIFNLYTSKQNAYSLLAMIRHYQLDTKCVSDWPDPIMTYWLKN